MENADSSTEPVIEHSGPSSGIKHAMDGLDEEQLRDIKRARIDTTSVTEQTCGSEGSPSKTQPLHEVTSTAVTSTISAANTSCAVHSTVSSVESKIPMDTAATITSTTSNDSCTADAPTRDVATATKIRRKKAVLMLSYSGTGYSGMQRNPGVNTIEDELLRALLKADAILEEHTIEPQSCQFQRTARTDKGVHAARQVVSLKMAVDFPDMAERLNSYLPEQIRVMAMTRVPRSFNCKLQCTARRYQYLAPTYAFMPKGNVSVEEARAFRIDADTVSRINAVLAHFKGTHNFHNYTSRKTCDDRSARRYMMNVSCGAPTVRDGVEFVTITVHGQSFMLHQIRKMVGLTMAVVRGYAPQAFIQQSFQNPKCDIPKAPGLGLLLDAVFFDVYNKKFKNDPSHPPLGWKDLDPVVEKFKDDFIFSGMVATEKSELIIFTWLQSLQSHCYDGPRPDDNPTANQQTARTEGAAQTTPAEASQTTTKGAAQTTTKGEAPQTTTKGATQTTTTEASSELSAAGTTPHSEEPPSDADANGGTNVPDSASDPNIAGSSTAQSDRKSGKRGHYNGRGAGWRKSQQSSKSS
eukprot:m.272561 g.272561  ORF g.272561 m.272561 type:complete len:580 (-) comp19747_c0_seq8:1737-3476(-)